VRDAANRKPCEARAGTGGNKMNNRKNETRNSTARDDQPDAKEREKSKGAQETALGDLKPRADIKGGSLSGIHQATDVTLKRGVVG
jgi:hypothetical protein